MSVLTADELSALQVDQASLRTLPRRVRRKIARIDEHIGTDSRKIIAAAASATPFTVHPELNQSLRGNQIRRHEILEMHPPLSSDELLLLKSLILNPDSHIQIRFVDYRHHPEVALRFHGGSGLSVLVDFMTVGWWIRKEGGAWGPDTRFDPVAQQVIDLLSPYRIQEHHDLSPVAPE